jgi:hypothetical protein
MTLKCQSCGYIVECITHNFCPECGLNLNNNHNSKQAELEKDKHSYKISIFKTQDKITERHNKIRLKFFDKNEISRITNLKNNLSKITSLSHNATSNLVSEIMDNVDEGFDKIKENVDEGFDKIKENVDEGFDKIKEKIMINVDSCLKSIIKTTNDPNVIMVAKALSKHSPKIAIIVASYALAGLPYGTVITQIAGFAVGQLVKSGDTSPTDKNTNWVNSSSITPIIEKIVNQLLPNSSKSDILKKCINCSYPIISDARFCSSCGKEIKDKLEANNLVPF